MDELELLELVSVHRGSMAEEKNLTDSVLSALVLACALVSLLTLRDGEPVAVSSQSVE